MHFKALQLTGFRLNRLRYIHVEIIHFCNESSAQEERDDDNSAHGGPGLGEIVHFVSSFFAKVLFTLQSPKALRTKLCRPRAPQTSC